MQSQITNKEDLDGINITTEQAFEMYEGLWRETIRQQLASTKQDVKMQLSLDEIVAQSDRDMAFLTRLNL